MGPLRLHFFLTLAVNHAGLSGVLAGDIFLQAMRQLKERWPLVGCALPQGASYRIIIIGRQ